MTLNRLFIIIGVVVLLLTGGVVWLWQYAYSAEGRARVIVAQLKGDTSSFRGWLLQHGVIRPGYPFDLAAERSRAAKAVEEAEERQTSAPERDASFFESCIQAELAHARQSAATQELVKLDAAARPVVFQALQDDNYDVRMAAAGFCEKVPDPSEIEPLANSLRRYRAKTPRRTLCANGRLNAASAT